MSAILFKTQIILPGFALAARRKNEKMGYEKFSYPRYTKHKSEIEGSISTRKLNGSRKSMKKPAISDTEKKKKR